MNDENELLEPLATEAGQEAIVRAIRDISSLEYAVRAEQAASQASAKAGEASQSAIEASNAEDKAKDWATKTDGYVEQETITIPPEQEGEEPTTETINLYSARYYAALAQDIYNNMSFDSVPTENSTNMVNSGTVYSALDLKADKSTTYTKTETDNLINTRLAELVASAPATLDTLQELATALGNDPNFATTIATQLGNKADKSTTYTKTEVDTALSAKADQSTTYTKTEVDTALSNVQSTLTFDNVPTANSDNPVKSSGIKTALDGKQDTLTFDSTPTANSTNPVTSGGIYTALQNVDANIEVDTEITEDSDNPVTSAAIYAALQNFTPSGGGGGAGNASGVQITELWGNDNGCNTGNLTLSDSYKNYDIFAFNVTIPSESPTSNSPIMNPVLITKQQLEDSKVGKFSVSGWGQRSNHFVVVNDTTFNCTLLEGNQRVYKIYGIKFSKNLSEQMYSNVLYENSSGVKSGTINLSGNISDYDLISFKLNRYVNDIKKEFVFSANYFEDNEQCILNFGEISESMTISKSGDNIITINWASNNSPKIVKITGIKLAKGGYSGIVSDARMTVKSGTGELASNINSGSFGYIPVAFDSPMPDINYVISVSISNIDLINGADKARIGISNSDKTVNGFKICIMARDGYTVYSGLKVDWIAIRPNSYTREGMVEDVLFSNASGVNSGTINLSGNISDYDLIQFTFSKVGEIYSSNDPNIITKVVSTDEMVDIMTTKQSKYVVEGLSNCFIVFNSFLDNSISISYNHQDALSILKITGIKFGRYVSGVAVDTTVTQNSNAVVTSGAVYNALQNVSGGGGGSSVTVDSSITQNSTNPVESAAIYTALSGKADTSTTLSGYGITDAYTQTEVDTALSSKGDVTTNTDQNITGTKTFVGSKKVAFKQSTTNDKLGFTLYGNTGTERGYLEFNPTNTVDGVTGLMTLGNYATSAASLTQVGFRRYSNISGASGAYNLLMPMVADARTPFSLTTTYQNFYLPLGFTDGTTTVRTAKSGVVDLSPLLASLEARIAALEGN